MQNIATAMRVARFADDDDFKEFIERKTEQPQKIEDELPNF